MKKRIAIIGGIVVIVGLVGGLLWHFLSTGEGGAKNGEDVVYVSTVSSLTKTASGTQNRYAGVVDPQETVEVKLESNRVVQEVFVEVGQEVKAGEPLFNYDSSVSQDNLQQAQLELEQLQNDVLSLQEQLSTLEKEKKEASQDNQLSYTIQIQQTKMDIKKNEYSQTSKAQEIEKLKSAAANITVTSSIDGVIKSIDSSKLDSASSDTFDEGLLGDTSEGGEGSAFITILGTGTYRIKGTINEQNIQSIIEGLPVLIRSRVDQGQTWRGTMGVVDRENPISSGSQDSVYMIGGMSSSSDEDQTSSSNYPFYVNLEDADGLMLGQHVYIEMDYGQSEEKDGLWLDAFYIVDADTDPYVWKSNEKDRLIQQKIKLGEYDENLDKYEILEGLSQEDCIAFPTEFLEEGLSTQINDGAQIPYTGGVESIEGEDLSEDLNGELIQDGPGMELIDEPDMEDANEVISPDGPFAEDIMEEEYVQEGVSP